MQARFMITNGGPHPADKWAAMTAEYLLDLVQVDRDSVSDAATAARRELRELRPRLEKILESHHADVQAGERDSLQREGVDRLGASLDPTEHKDLDALTFQIASAAADLPTIGPHFDKPEVRAAIGAKLAEHFATSMDVERSWHADRNADHPAAKAFRAARVGAAEHVVAK